LAVKLTFNNVICHLDVLRRNFAYFSPKNTKKTKLLYCKKLTSNKFHTSFCRSYFGSH